MAFKFANENADKYINDEDPLGALRDGFLCGCQKKEQQFKEYLEKLKDKYDKEYKVAIANNEDYEVGKAYGRLCIVIEIINELFPESEEPDNSNKDD